MGEKKLLKDVVVIRPLFIAIVVIYHAFIIYMGGWDKPKNFIPIDEYNWLANFLYFIRMQGFVFMAGYVYAYQVLALKKDSSLVAIILKKFKRLILPSIFFSLIYFFIFYNRNDYSLFSGIIKILSGAGHMWFLPMLFWCFLWGKLLLLIRNHDALILIVLLLFSLLPWPIPLGIGRALQYMVFFWGGFLVWKYHDIIMSKLNKSLVFFVLILFLGTYVVSIWFKGLALFTSDEIIFKVLNYVINSAVSLVVTLFGISTVYLLVNYFIEKKQVMPASWVFKASSVCYGVYIFQQFILQILYYKTSLPVLVGAYWLPWVGCVVTFIVSIELTRLTLKTKFGRFLIG